MAMSGGSDDGEPMMDLNTTPLIDVMLVLLIMFIITIPPQTHAVPIDLPVQSKDQQQVVVDPIKNKVLILADGSVQWNGAPVNDALLSQYLEQTKTINPEPELHFQPDPAARYAVVDRVLAVIKRSEISKLGFIGNEQYREDF